MYKKIVVKERQGSRASYGTGVERMGVASTRDMVLSSLPVQQLLFLLHRMDSYGQMLVADRLCRFNVRRRIGSMSRIISGFGEGGGVFHTIS